MRKQVYAKRKQVARSSVIFLLIVSLLIYMCVKVDKAIRPDLCALCVAETQHFAANVMAQSVEDVLEQQPVQYEDLAVLQRDANGNVTSVETRTEKVNQLQSALLREIQQNLKDCRDVELQVSLGTATGIWLFAGKGPYVKVRLMPIGSANVKLISKLESAGVNQTCHTIQAKVTANIQAAIPFSQTTAEIEYDYLLTETVIVGNVPEFYFEYGSEQA